MLLQPRTDTLNVRFSKTGWGGLVTLSFSLTNEAWYNYTRCISWSNTQFSLRVLKEPIPGHIRAQILSELKDVRNVCELLSTLEMAIGFLSAAGGDPEMKINDYFRTVLLIADGKSNLKSKKVR